MRRHDRLIVVFSTAVPSRERKTQPSGSSKGRRRRPSFWSTESASASSAVMGTLRHFPLFGVPDSRRDMERRMTICRRLKSMSLHFSARISPCRAPVCAAVRISGKYRSRLERVRSLPAESRKARRRHERFARFPSLDQSSTRDRLTEVAWAGRRRITITLHWDHDRSTRPRHSRGLHGARARQ